MDRPRRKRKDPQRTGPIRNAGEAWREREPRRDSARRREDAASGGVRDGYRVIEEQIRRGRRMAQELDDELRSDDRYDRERRRRSRDSGEPGLGYEPWSGYGEEPWPRSGGDRYRLLGMPLRHLEHLVREILRQIVSLRPDPWRLIELLFRLQIELMSELARLGFGALGMTAPRWEGSYDDDARRAERDIDEDLDEIEDVEEEIEDELWDWPAAPSVPIVIRSTVPIPVYVWSYERTEIDLELPAGAQSLDLEIEPPLATGTDQSPHPAFEAELVTLSDGPVILRIEVPRDLPAGLYRRRVLVRATGEPVGNLTVQVGTAPDVAPPRKAAAPKKGKKR